MPQLQHDPPPLGMDRVSHFFPSRNLGVRVNPGFPRTECRVALDGHCRLGDNQSRAGPLRVVLDHQVRGDVLDIRPAACERSHENAIRKNKRTERHRSEERSVVHG